MKNRILIVDDEKTNLDILNHILKNEYTIYIAKSGEMAIKRAMADFPDMILLDRILPDMDGYDVLKQLKESDTTRNIPVIFITGLADMRDEEKGFMMGAVDYIAKPFNNSTVKARIRTHMKMVRQMRTIERLGTLDTLTGIPNRRSFDERMCGEWSRSAGEKQPVGVFSIGVDLFKQYNDTYGHLQGDILLQTLADVLVLSLKRPADFVARTGREEFRVILPDMDQEGAVTVAQEIRQTMENLRIPGMGTAVTDITVSIGVAVRIPGSEDGYMEMPEEADKKLFHARLLGGNRVVFD